MIKSLQPFTVISGGGLVGNDEHSQEELDRFNRLEATYNNILISRRELMGRLMNRNRNIDEECGYPLPWTSNRVLDSQALQDLNDFDPIAATVNDLMARECFQSQFEIYEDESVDNVTEFENAVDALGGSITDEPSHYAGDTLCVIAGILKKAWSQAMVSHYGVILFGFDDILPGDVNGLAKPVQIAKYPARKILYIRTFPQHLATIARWDTDPTSPRYRKPLMYQLSFGTIEGTVVDGPLTDVGIETREVHHSRILHVCKDDWNNPYYHRPECQDVIKPIINLQKIYGSDAEGRWKVGFTTISIETTNPDITPDRSQLKNMIEDWDRGLLKVWTLDGGLTAKTLAPGVTDPTASIDSNLKLISIRKRIPKRKLEGSERGELSSAQDDGDWNDQVKSYQYNILNPRLVIPFFDRLINVGVLPVPGGPIPVNKRNISTLTSELGEPFRTRSEMVYPVLANEVTNKPQIPFTSSSNGKQTYTRTGKIPLSESLTTPSPPRSKIKRKEGGYYIHWPDIANQTDSQKAEIAAKIIAALGDAVQKGVFDIITDRDVLLGLFRGLFTEDEVDAWLKAADKAREEQQMQAHKQAQTDIETTQRKIDEGVQEDPQAEQRANEEELTYEVNDNEG